MISVLAPTVFAEGLSQEKAFHSCLMLKLFFTKSWLHRAWYRTSQLVLLGGTTGIPLRYEHLSSLRFFLKAPRPWKGARWCYHQKLDLNLQLTGKSVTYCLPLELFSHLRLPKPEGGRNNLVMNWSLFLGHALAYIKLDLGEFKLI